MPIASSEQKENNIEKNEIQAIKERIVDLYPDLLKEYKTIHEHPELGGEEFETARLIKEKLSELDIAILGEGLGGAGIVAEIVGKENGPTIALRADIDALQLTENPEHETQSKTVGKMHACGHDIHTASLLGAAEMLKEMADKNELDGRVVLIFQSNEEKALDKKSGAIPVIKFLEKSGVRSRIKSFFALHVVGVAERGTIFLADKVQYAGSSFVDVKMKTIGGHGSEIKILPDIDYILSDIKVKVADALNDYWERGEAVVDSMAPKTSQEADNIMMSFGERSWVVRVVAEDHKKISGNIHEKIKQIVRESVSSHEKRTIARAEAKGIKRPETAYEVEVDISVKPHTRPVIHRDKELVDLMDGITRESFPKSVRVGITSPATDDFSFFLEEFRGLEIPGIYMALGGANKEKGFPSKPHHSPDFAVDPESIKDLTEIYTLAAKKIIEHFNSKQNINASKSKKLEKSVK